MMLNADRYKGPWRNLSGPIEIPATVKHNGQFYMLTQNLLDVRNHEPPLKGNRVWLVMEAQPTATDPLTYQRAVDAFVTTLCAFEKPRCEYCRSTIVNLHASHCDNCGAPTP